MRALTSVASNRTEACLANLARLAMCGLLLCKIDDAYSED